MKNFRNHRRPCRYIFGLSIGLELCIVLEDTQSKPACAWESSVNRGYQMIALGPREKSLSNLRSCCLVLRSGIVVHPQKNMYQGRGAAGFLL